MHRPAIRAIVPCMTRTPALLAVAALGLFAATALAGEEDAVQTRQAMVEGFKSGTALEARLERLAQSELRAVERAIEILER